MFVCLFCSTLRVHSLSLSTSHHKTLTVSVYTFKTLFSVKLCRDFAKGLVFSGVCLKRDARLSLPLQRWRHSDACKSDFHGSLQSEQIFLFYCEKGRKKDFILEVDDPKRGRPAFLFPRSSSDIYNSYCVMGGWYFGEIPFAKINGTNNEQLMSTPWLQPEILIDGQKSQKQAEKVSDNLIWVQI